MGEQVDLGKERAGAAESDEEFCPWQSAVAFDKVE
jgi:hypothetical protein